MKHLKLLFPIFFLIFLNSCFFHVHIPSFPKKYVYSIETNIAQISNKISSEYDNNVKISVREMANDTLKLELEAMNVTELEITYRYDSTKLNSFQLKQFERIYVDSMITFRQTKSPNLENWVTLNEVSYYFGKHKPPNQSKKGKYSNFLKQLNDSVTFERIHFPYH